MLFSCSSPVCGEPGFDLVATTDAIVDVALSDVACAGVTASCTETDDGGACTTYYVLPTATGNCHVDVHLAKGTTFSADVKINRGTTDCPGFYPASAADAMIQVP